MINKKNNVITSDLPTWYDKSPTFRFNIKANFIKQKVDFLGK